MKGHPVTELYNKIMLAASECDIYDLTKEVQFFIESKILTEERDILLLNLALQVKSNYVLMKEVMMGTSIIVVGNSEDFDPEQMQLDEFHEQEFEDFKDGNVILMENFNKED